MHAACDCKDRFARRSSTAIVAALPQSRKSYVVEIYNVTGICGRALLTLYQTASWSYTSPCGTDISSSQKMFVMHSAVSLAR